MVILHLLPHVTCKQCDAWLLLRGANHVVISNWQGGFEPLTQTTENSEWSDWEVQMRHEENFGTVCVRRRLAGPDVLPQFTGQNQRKTLTPK